MRRVRWSWLAVALVVLTGLYFVTDVVVLRYIESRGAGKTKKRKPFYGFGGFSFSSRFL